MISSDINISEIEMLTAILEIDGRLFVSQADAEMISGDTREVWAVFHRRNFESENFIESSEILVRYSELEALQVAVELLNRYKHWERGEDYYGRRSETTSSNSPGKRPK